MSELYQQLLAVIPAAMPLPARLNDFYQWIEEHGRVERYGESLSGRLSDDWSVGSDIEFCVSGNPGLHYWFNKPALSDEIRRRLAIIANSGGDGSMIGLWLDDAGRSRFVHLGSGSGSTLCCVLADDLADFLRLVAIGYSELGFEGDFSAVPEADEEFQPVNRAFCQWVVATFGGEIPATGKTIVKYPDDMWKKDGQDPFGRWVRQQMG
ncbi:hypothetical protein FJU30_18530 [Affinibrenneria salicis]|uniref:SMI1/KNR4 family protein n=1 Tax=Affinibrenneria salicis TaxID=2590031 RepID=A0A5J5FVQ9_9GAMM|nr:hypothetical protein [Affinibrenneria salicis]KAA8997753.1 hypothetical protein FJU30_18530 [Affinibrenneria salicis]